MWAVCGGNCQLAFKLRGRIVQQQPQQMQGVRSARARAKGAQVQMEVEVEVGGGSWVVRDRRRRRPSSHFAVD